MTSDLDSLEPAAVWRYFVALSQIPRPSGHEERAAAWVAEQGRALGLTVERDAVGNVLIRKPATPGHEGAPITTLQGHVDMVCEKNEDTVHDFTVDPIRLRRDGPFLKATGTTLGADDGIGVAVGLAALASTDVPHGPLELLVTVDEESGLTGANALQPGWLRGSILLNLDSEEEGFLTIGCGGGVDTVATRTVTWEAAPAGYVGRRLRVFGLKGGHSGVDIDLGRANAIRVLAQVLDVLGEHRLGAVRGGNKRNAIPREASAVVFVAAERLGAVEEAVRRAEADLRATFGTFDPGVTLALDPTDDTQALSVADGQAVTRILLALPHGVEARSPDVPGLVLTSTNLGVLRTEGDSVEVCLLTRSAINAARRALTDRIAAVCALAGFQSTLVGGYPGWKPEPGAGIVKLVADLWQERTGRELKIIAIHAGLECGLIGEKYPGMQMVSFGPDMADAHTPDERVDIASVGRFWDLLRAVLTRIAA
jgi:dipeptidase D